MKKFGVTPLVAGGSAVAIVLHLLLRFVFKSPTAVIYLPLKIALLVGGAILLMELVKKIRRREVGSDILAGLSIVTSFFLGEYLAGTIIVLMLSGGAVLERYAVDTASSVLKALAKRMPNTAHRRHGTDVIDIELGAIVENDTLVVFPHEICPADGVVIEGHSVMDESYLTGEPFRISKAPGSTLLSGAINGDGVLVMKATNRPVDSRYAKIMSVVRAAQDNPPRLRRLGDKLGAIYAPLALIVSLAAWGLSGSLHRFLAVLVIATPCPLILAIPIAVIGAISLCARRGIIVKKPVALEQIESCDTIIFDKTGTLTYGRPKLTDVFLVPPWKEKDILSLAASLERYSRHPLAQAIREVAEEKGAGLSEATHVSEKPGEGLSGVVQNHVVKVIGRKILSRLLSSATKQLPSATEQGLESILVIDDAYAATLRFRDEPRTEGFQFIAHLGPKHRMGRKVIISGDRETEARYLAEKVGITEVYGGKSPEEKLALVKATVQNSKTVFVGDGINDAPALLASTVGIAIGANSDITSEAASVVILDSSLSKIDEFFHISRRMKSIALQSAVGGMILSAIGMGFAAWGYLTPVEGAILQEVIDVLAIGNALRASFLPKTLVDF